MENPKRPTIRTPGFLIIERTAIVNGHTVRMFRDQTLPANADFNVAISSQEPSKFWLTADLSAEDANKLFDKFVTELGAQKEPPGTSPNLPGGSPETIARPE